MFASSFARMRLLAPINMCKKKDELLEWVAGGGEFTHAVSECNVAVCLCEDVDFSQGSRLVEWGREEGVVVKKFCIELDGWYSTHV